MTSHLQALPPSGEPLEDENLITIEVHLPIGLYAELQREVEEGQHSADSLVGAERPILPPYLYSTIPCSRRTIVGSKACLVVCPDPLGLEFLKSFQPNLNPPSEIRLSFLSVSHAKTMNTVHFTEVHCPQVEVDLAFSLEELAQAVHAHFGRLPDPKQAYQWLPFCLIPEPKSDYTQRDLKKFLFVAARLTISRKFNQAREALIDDLKAHEQYYNPEVTIDGFIQQHPTLQRASRKLAGKPVQQRGANCPKRGRQGIKKIQAEVA